MNRRLSHVLQDSDPIATSLVVALLAHALLILGVNFNFELPGPEDAVLPTLDITMLSHRTDAAPDDPDYLATANQDGGGNTREKVKPTPAMAEQAPPPQPAESLPRPAPVLTRVQAERQAPDPAEERPELAAPPVNAAQLMMKSMDLVSLNEQINQQRQAYTDRPRQTFISARTREYKYASYMAAWVAKVERVGDLNYPDEARRRRLSGTLLLDVALNADGSIQSMNLRRSSGHKVLDDAAMRIARLAAPYAPFPADIRKDTDVLHITRTWDFSNSYQMKSR